MDFQKLIAVVKSRGLVAVQNFKALPARTKKKVYIGVSVVFGLIVLNNISRPAVNQQGVGQPVQISEQEQQILAHQYNASLENNQKLALAALNMFNDGAGVVANSPSSSKADIMIIKAADGTFLGTTSSNQYDQNSICNRYGTFGSKHNQQSIFNVYGTYGGRLHSDLGAYNERANKPPLVIDSSGNVLGVVSKNAQHQSRIDPDILRIQVCGEPL